MNCINMKRGATQQELLLQQITDCSEKGRNK